MYTLFHGVYTFFISFVFLLKLILLLVCLSTFKTTPIAPKNTIRLVLPALTNGNGNPVGGIAPDTTP